MRISNNRWHTNGISFYMKPEIPVQETGAATDVIEKKNFDSLANARSAFLQARDLLLDVNNWHTLCGAASSKFILTDSDGKEIQRNAQEGDHFKIDVPGPGSATGEGYDWVKIECIEEKINGNEGVVCITVRPATNPNNANPDIAHFFTEEASSSFVVRQKGLEVNAEVHGRNEKPNTNAEQKIDKIRNFLFGIGATAGASKLQWTSLVKGLLVT